MLLRALIASCPLVSNTRPCFFSYLAGRIPDYSNFSDMVSIHLNRNHENDLFTNSQNRSKFTSQAGLAQFPPDKTDAMANEDAKDLPDQA